MSDYRGKFFEENDFDPAEWTEYYVYRCEGGYLVWTYEPSQSEVDGLERVC